jgi:hypothetical protein
MSQQMDLKLIPTLSECFKHFMSIPVKDRPPVKMHPKQYESEQGNITFWWETSELIIYVIVVKETERRKGIFSALLNEITKHSEIDKLCIAGVGSFELVKLLDKIIIDKKGFCDHGGDFCWFKDGKCPRGHDPYAPRNLHLGDPRYWGKLKE